MKVTVFIILVNTLYLQKKKKMVKTKTKGEKGFIARIGYGLHTAGAGTEQRPQKVLEPRHCEKKGCVPSEFSLPHSLANNGYD